MNDSRKPPESGESPGPSDAGKQNLLNEVARRSLEFMEDRFVRFVDDTREQLIDEFNEAGSDTRQGVYFEAFTILKKNGDKVVADLSSAVKKQFTEFREVEFAIPGGKYSEELALVEEEEFEIWLAESEAASSAESRLHQDLHALEARLSVIRGQRVDSRNNPVGPRALAHYATRILIELSTPHLALPIAIRSYGAIVLLQSGKLYAALNEYLIEQGVLPNFSLKVKKSRRAPSTPETSPSAGEPPERPGDAEAGASRGTEGDGRGATGSGGGGGGQTGSGGPGGTGQTGTGAGQAADGGAGGGGGGGGQPASPASTVIDIRDILTRRGVIGGKPPYSGDPETTPPLNLDELDEALAELESEASEFVNQRLEKRIEEAVAKRFGEDGERRLDRPQADAVFLTDELLTTMTGDAIVSERGKDWIRKLELPLLRMLLRDESLIEDPEHPARHVLNLLGQVHWRPEEMLSARDRETIERINQVVNELSEHQEFQGSELEAAALELESLLKRGQRRLETNTRRVVETAEGQQKLARARAQVEDMLADRLAGQRVPKVLLDLLESGWRDLLTLAMVRSGPDSSEVSSTVEIIDQLKQRIEKGEKDSDADEALVAQVKDRLEQSGADPRAQRDVLTRLEGLLHGDVPPETVDLPPRSEPEPEPDEAAEADPDSTLWLGQAKLLDVGNWMLCPDESGHVRPLKLAWINEDRSKYVFVGRDGQKALEIEPEELAARLKSDDASIADHRDEPLMDRSWQGIVQRMHDQIAHQATHDELTGLLNRKEFERRMKLKISESKLINNIHIAMLADIDQFRVINSTAGHEAGDRLLQNIAELLRQTLPDDAQIARIGADEFAVLVPRCVPARGHELAGAIRKAVAEHNTGWMTRRLRATVSIGVVGIDRDTGPTGDLFQRLEVAVDAAKEEGDRVRSFEIDDKDLSRRDEALRHVADVEEAIDTDRLELFAQRIRPLVETDDEAGHFEVLARIREENGDLLQPGQFIPAAEAYGRIHFLDEAVIDQTFRMFASSPIKDEIERLSINISGRTFGRPQFVGTVRELLDRHEIPASSICIEITESAAMSNLSRCADVLRELRYLGCEFSLDDFGTGLSSFGYLKHLPVDYLKIDGSFIQELTVSSADYGLVRTINEMAHLLGKKTIAEYVETDETIDALKKIGVDYIQGFAIEKPRPLNEILSIS